MKIKEVLEMTKENKLSHVVKEINVGRDRLRNFLNEIGCEHQRAKTEWIYKGDRPEILEENIYNYVHKTGIRKPNKERTNERKNESTNKEIKTSSNKDLNIKSEERTNEPTIKGTKEPKKERTEERKSKPTNETLKISRKRTSFDLDIELVKKLKLKAVQEDKNLYELVENAIRDLLKKDIQ
ncbi:hypothetical protein [Priestia megaterium]|uniref:hypothetical protein n=1 Tax=Priestia megaterium TaxID=1404 RepID=UPI0011457F94|nr:hypothetical protein [Priestia megaterium]